jgi:hypothetical protein
MKTAHLFLAFPFILVFVLFFSACEDGKFPDLKKNKIIVEFIEQNYLVLKPSDLSSLSYQNPRNIFLEKQEYKENKYIGNWYKKSNGVYQIFSLRDESARELDTNLAYEVIDTLHVSDEAYKIDSHYGEYISLLNQPLETAYQNGSYFVEKIKQREMLRQYFWTKTKFSSQDSVLNYDPQTKSFFTSKTKMVSEIKTDLGPIIIVILFFLFSLFIIFREKIPHLKEFEDKFVKNNKHRVNSWILFIIITVFNAIYFIITEHHNVDIAATIFMAVIIGIFVKLLYWPSKYFKDKIHFNFNKLASITYLTGILALELMLLEAAKDFRIISLVLVILPAVVNLITETVLYLKYKKNFTKPGVNIVN